MEMVTPLDVRPIEPRELDATAELVATAMDVDAAYQYLFPDHDLRPRGLRDLFVRNLRLHMGHRCTYVALDRRSEVVGTVTLRPPGGIPISGPAMVRHGLLPFAFAHGAGAVKRLLWLKATYDALERELGASKPYWYVHMMAVRPGLQGQGIGSVLLERVLAITRATTSGLDVILTTHLTRNLAFYRRALFEVDGERTLAPPGGPPYPVWAMRRPTPCGRHAA